LVFTASLLDVHY